MRRQVPGIMLLLLAVWMCGLTFMVVYYPDFFLGERAEGVEQAAVDNQEAETTPPVVEERPKEPPVAQTSILVAARDLKWDEIDELKAEPSFQLSGESLAALQADGVPGEVLENLKGLVNQDTMGEIDFLNLLLTEIGGDPTVQYKPLIFEYARSDMLKAVSYPNHLLPDGYIEAEALPDIDGQILMVDLKEDEPLLEYKLHRNQARLIEDRTELNQRAMSVKVDQVIGVAGFIKPYSRVDVLVTLHKRKPPETRTVLRNVLVLATGDRGDRAKSSFADRVESSLPDRVADSVISPQDKGEKQAPQKVPVVTLQVSPEQAEKLALASSEGKLRLVLRNPRDKTLGQTQGINLRSLLSEGKRRGRPRYRVEVRKGSEVEMKYFSQ